MSWRSFSAARTAPEAAVLAGLAEQSRHVQLFERRVAPLIVRPTRLSMGAQQQKEAMKTISTLIAFIGMLAALAIPAAAEVAKHSPRASERAMTRADNNYTAFDAQVPTSATELNEQVYHGGPKVND